MNKLLGLDLSTSVCGWCLLNEDGSLHDVGYIDLKKCEDLYQKVDLVKDFFSHRQEFIDDVQEIFIEEPVMAFSTSTAFVISLLQRFNGFVSSMFYITFGIKPKLISSSHARKLNGIKLIRGQNTKLQIYEHVKKLKVIPENVWQFKRTGSPKDCMFDLCDAYVVALAGFREVYSKKT